MSKNRTHASRSNEPSTIPAWVWLFTGAVLGAFVMFLMHLSDVKPDEDKAIPHSGTATDPDKKETTQKPRFDFYDLLKQSDIPVYEEKEEEAQAKPSKKVEHTPTQELLLQVASFRSDSDAERLRAELILLNLTAYTEKAKIRNGETWHRVMVGPFRSTSTLSKARSILLSNQHEALVLKRQTKE